MSALADNIAFFVRALRSAGLKIGPSATLTAIEAVSAIPLDNRADMRAALHATLVTRHEDTPVFDETFRLFFRPRNLTEAMLAMLSPKAPPRERERIRKPGSTRVEDAFSGSASPRQSQRPPILELDARGTASGDEVFRHADFAQMSAAELAKARKAVAAFVVPGHKVRTRRFTPSRTGTFDARRTLKGAMRSGGDLMLPAFRDRRMELPPIVVLADISGSMSAYSRIFLHFAHALTERHRRVHTFLFGTRLTNVTRALRHRDPDEAFDACTKAASDWSGGTRIGTALARFNRDWSRRVLGQGAVVLLVTDGLERGDTDELSHEIERLHRSSRRLVWLCPLLGYEGFAAKAKGVRAMLPHVDEFRPVHSLASIEALCEDLSRPTAKDRAHRRFLPEAA